AMKGTLLRFYVQESRKHRHILLYAWLLERAKDLGIHGGSAFRAIAGFGRHGVMREEHFFELAGDLTVQVDFAVSDDDAQRLIDLVTAEHVGILYMRAPVEFGVTDGG
ncbi:MAG TPA: DUF190 domain-containing protein, partial [Casimicrobiaceae bacterium]|nr:DUF190 domain-containing protein [Casimicrobiaceae bacterium]